MPIVDDKVEDKTKVSYRDTVERLKIEFSHFLRLCEAGRTVRHAALKARKKSILLRQLLKDFRNVSLENDAKILEIMNKAKEELKKEL
jgi:hypothetical protein